MKDIILVGAGGCMRELAWQILESNKIHHDWNIIGYVDEVALDSKPCVKVAGTEIRYLGDDKYIINAKQNINVVMSIGNSQLRRKILERYRRNPHVRFPNLVLRNATVSQDLIMGEGCIVSMGTKISTNVRLGNFVFINMGATICHDGRIDDFVSISPGAMLAGNVQIGAGTEIGIGTNIIQGKSVGSNVVIGAGCVVIESTGDDCTMVGVPARKVR